MCEALLTPNKSQSLAMYTNSLFTVDDVWFYAYFKKPLSVFILLNGILNDFSFKLESREFPLDTMDNCKYMFFMHLSRIAVRHRCSVEVFCKQILWKLLVIIIRN